MLRGWNTIDTESLMTCATAAVENGCPLTQITAGAGCGVSRVRR